MFAAEEFRAKAMECTLRKNDTADPSELRELQRLEQSFTWLANNEEWLADRLEISLRSQAGRATEEGGEGIDNRPVAAVEEHVLRCLGAAVMHWNTIPTKLQRELFDTAGSMGELLRSTDCELRLPAFFRPQT